MGPGIDPAALLMRALDPATETVRAGPSLVQARLSDATEVGRVNVGKGALDVTAYTAALAASGYGGAGALAGKPPVTRWVVVDLRGLADQAAGARAAVSAWSPS